MQLSNAPPVPPAEHSRSRAAGIVSSDIEAWEGEGGAHLDKRAEGVSQEPAGQTPLKRDQEQQGGAITRI